MADPRHVLAEHFPDGLAPDTPLEPLGGDLPGERHALTPQAAADLAIALKQRAVSQLRIPVRKILGVLANVHREWARPRSPLRREAVEQLFAATGFPRPLLDEGLRHLFATLDVREMENWLREGCASPDLLDIHQPGPAPGILVLGPALTVLVAGGNVPGAAIPSVAQALLLKSPCLVKSSSHEPYLLPLYARSVADAAPDVAAALAVTCWSGGAHELEAAVLAEAEALIAYGSNASLKALRDQLPVTARFLGYGHGISFSAIGREYLAGAGKAAETAQLAAQDIATFDQQGCFSPQTIYLERGRGVSPEAFGELMAASLEEMEASTPRAAISPAESAAIHQYRAEIEMRSLQEAGLRLWTSPAGTNWTVVLDANPELEPCVLNRTCILRPVDDLEQLPRWLAPHRASLMAAALRVGERRLPRIARGLAAAGITRITQVGSAQQPQGALHHGGVNAVAALARFVTIERMD